MTGETILFLCLGAVAGGFINGLSGTGTALFALGFYLVVLEPVTAVAVVAFMAVLVGFQGLWIVRDEIFAQHGFERWVGSEDTYRRFYCTKPGCKKTRVQSGRLRGR